MEFETEKRFTCPYCGEKISVLLEDFYSSQSYIEDCEVCCRPIQITYETDDGAITGFSATRAQ